MTGTIDDALWPAEDKGRLDVQRELDQISETTALVEQAKGVLIFRYAIAACSAYKLMERWAASAGVGIEKVAHTLVQDICQGGDPREPSDRRFVRWLEDQLRHEFPDDENIRAERAPVTVAVDQSDCSLDAVVEAARTADRMGLPLQITIQGGSLATTPEPQRAHLAQRVQLAGELARAVAPAVDVRLPTD